MYMNIINDVSCLVDGKIIVLAEHQSNQSVIGKQWIIPLIGNG